MHKGEVRSGIDYKVVDGVALFTVSNPPVNALSHAVRVDLEKNLKLAAEDETVKAIVLTGQGRGFIAGADIREFKKPPQPPHLNELISGLEDNGKIVIAAIHGAALGGGLEMALGCHYRIAHPKSLLGLPEVNLGILPGAGGTQRLPRLVGLEKALGMITTGRPIKANDALACGLIDQISEGDDMAAAGIAFAKSLISEGKKPRAVSALPAPADDPELFATWEKKVARSARGQKSPVLCVESIKNVTQMPFEQGLKRERELFLQLKNDEQHSALSYAFFSDRALGRLPELEGVKAREIQTVGVIGGGTMGAGIATSAVMNGLIVTLIEQNEDALDKAFGRISKNFAAAVKRGKMSQERADKLLSKSLHMSADLNDLANVDVVVEAVFEKLEVKQEVFGRLDKICKQGAVLATNTSYLDVNKIADVTSRPQDVIGLHFFSPAHVMKLLEIVIADKTAPEVTATGFKLAKIMKKVAVRAGVCDGFIGNRILTKYRAAAEEVVLAGATPFEVDAAIKGFGFPMGTFEVSDLAGIDIGYMTRQRRASTRDKRERVYSYSDRLYEQGWYGQKTGKGFYIYEAGTHKGVPNPEVNKIVEAERKERGIIPRKFSAEEIIDRYMAAMINEAAKVLEDGIALRPLDVDMTLLYGYGFPRWRGGPLHYADHVGLPKILARIEEYAKDYEYFWQPSKLLKKLVDEGKTFSSLNDLAK
ncbi:3-hydroxyacyl-CoA dehydrogenase NAD-binding domain-containing protein [Flexibacterium corallicola]|uniref:3-hydroxyacyl-CoA dehydrogenase NAD-binding domain-containing protein n=1 Tax=Flexibacterium corallicola TaxID=3037259 RepID=UPI00286F54CD|nr:3-hydroxyacyl-CoA dehydrogenase NAD-binding domain-containing protein [Pseudovibrio sp. M1P-2-3]